MDDLDALLERAWQAYAADDTLLASALAQKAVSLAEDDGPAWYCLACCHERSGDVPQAHAAFQRAAQARIDPQAIPCHIDAEEFRQLAEQVLTELPPSLQPAVSAVDLVVMDHCPPGLLIDTDDIELLGLCDGPEHGDLQAEWGEPILSPCLYLFRRPHEHACSDRAELEREIRITVIHELGHHLGFDEDALDAMGLG